jgi:hypothetical protein
MAASDLVVTSWHENAADAERPCTRLNDKTSQRPWERQRALFAQRARHP